MTKHIPALLDRSHLRVALWIFLTFSVLYVGLTRGRFLSTDEIEVYQATKSLWEQGNASIQSPEGTLGRAGCRFTARNSGLSVAALPLYGLGKVVESVFHHLGKDEWATTFSGSVIERTGGDRWSGETGIFFVNLYNCFATAALCALFYCFSLRIGASARRALLSTALLGLTSYIAPFSTGFFQHSSEALLLLAAFYFLFLDGQMPDWRCRLLAGAMTALLLQFRFPAIIAVPGLLVYHCALIWQRQKAKGVFGFRTTLRQLVPFTGALILGLILHAADQFAKFGTIRMVGLYATVGYNTPLWVGLYAFLFSPGDSIFLFTPLLVLLPWTLCHLNRSFRTEVIFIVGQASVYLIFYGKFDTWHGLWCLGPRYLAAVVPLLMLPLGPWLERCGYRNWPLVALLALFGLWVQVIHFAVDFWSVALHENYLNFQPTNGFLFIPAASQIVAHSKALVAWDSRVDMWLVTIYRTFGAGRFLLLFIPLAALLTGCLWQLRRSVRMLGPANAPASISRVMHHPTVTADLRTLRAKPLLTLSMLLLLTIVTAYSNHFHNGFHFDDSHTIVNNAFIHDVRNIPRYFVDGTTFSTLPQNQSYRPIVSTLLAIDYSIGGGLQPFWFHASGFLYFLTLVLLLGFVIYRLLETRGPSTFNPYIAILACSFYALHPANADTVNYIIAQSDLLSTLAVVASFAAYLAFPKQRRWHAYLLPAVIGILAKPPAAMFAPLFSFYRLFFPEESKAGENKLRRLGAYIWSIAPAFIACIGVAMFVQHMTPKSWIGGATDTQQYLITQPYVMMLYFKTFFYTGDLSADYDLNPFTTTDDPRFWAGIAFLMFLGTLTVFASLRQSTRMIGFGLLWFFIALLPTSLWPLAEVMNDHRTFFPFIGLIIASAGAVSALLESRKSYPLSAKLLAGLVTLMLMLVCSLATYQRNAVWKNEETLWRDVVAKSPHNARGLMNYGLTFMAVGNMKDAIIYFRRAEKLAPAYPTLQVNIAIAEGAMGQPVLAEQSFRKALVLAHQNPDCYTYYARWLVSQQRLDQAAGLVQAALKLSPANLDARNLASQIAATRATHPSAEQYLALSLHYYQTKQYQECITSAGQALKLKPDCAEAWNNIGAAYNNLQQFDKAKVALEVALRLKPDFPLARNNLAYTQSQVSAASK